LISGGNQVGPGKPKREAPPALSVFAEDAHEIPEVSTFQLRILATWAFLRALQLGLAYISRRRTWNLQI